MRRSVSLLILLLAAACAGKRELHLAWDHAASFTATRPDGVVSQDKFGRYDWWTLTIVVDAEDDLLSKFPPPPGAEAK